MPALPPDPAGVVEVAGPWTHRHVAANGARFHVAEAVPASRSPASRGPLVLLLHGFPEFWWSWREQLPRLAEHGFHVAAMDLRGYGGSDKPPRGYDLPTLAADVAGVVKALGRRRAVLVGHGWGGLVGWTAAAMHPGEVRGLCAVAAPHPLLMVDPKAWLRAPSRRRSVTAHLVTMQTPFLPERRLSSRPHEYVAAHLRAWSGPGTFPEDETVDRYGNALALWPAAHCALEYHRWLARSQLRADGRRYRARMEVPVAAPVCVVHGGADPAVAPTESERSAARVSGSFESHRIPHVGHYPHEEDPAAFDEILFPWLARLTGS